MHPLAQALFDVHHCCKSPKQHLRGTVHHAWLILEFLKDIHIRTSQEFWLRGRGQRRLVIDNTIASRKRAHGRCTLH